MEVALEAGTRLDEAEERGREPEDQRRDPRDREHHELAPQVAAAVVVECCFHARTAGHVDSGIVSTR
jgi:hypothetical protein